ncbi:hypothetical protein [Staphylococcus sp. Marseille-Q1834]
MGCIFNLAAPVLSVVAYPEALVLTNAPNAPPPFTLVGSAPA